MPFALRTATALSTLSGDVTAKEIFQLARVIKKVGKLNEIEDETLLYILERLARADVMRTEQLFTRVGLPVRDPAMPVNRYLELMRRDKKVVELEQAHGAAHFFYFTMLEDAGVYK